GGVLGALPEGPRVEALRRVDVPELEEDVPEGEDGPRVPRIHVEDRLEEDARVFGAAAPGELLRLEDDVPRLRGLDTQGLPEGVEGVREAPRPEQEVRPLDPRLPIAAVRADHPAVAHDGGPLP